MALWGQAAMVAQLAVVTAQQNKEEYDQLPRRVFMIAELLPHLQDPDVMRWQDGRQPLVGLNGTMSL
ncbi:hypothetical protein E2562_019742 [Oryza meyeriana var. granulata]|uniref:Uncharacterized protein n=1 Tax=Oryza meyeriana var. granulata TaxID=110450 RepID=A0A6G1C7Y1_9ORYZ|nr:hypothetical protein E2562_019742 [Oryza meyeriana var. granulata]